MKETKVKKIDLKKFAELLFSMRGSFLYMMKSVLADFNLTPAQKIGMEIIQGKGFFRMANIAEILGITNSATTQLMNSLEKKGLVTRIKDNSDKRAFKMKISSKGEALLKEIRKREIMAMENYFECLNEFEINIFMKTIEKINRNFNKSKCKCL